MCFSMEADLVAGATIVPLGVLTLSHVREAREVPLASVPLLLGLHQLVEAGVWAGVDGSVPAGLAHAAAWVYVVLALPVLPLLVPTAVYLVEDRAHRRRVLPFLVLGAITTGFMTQALATHGVTVRVFDHALGYSVGLGPTDWFSTATYVVAVVGACLASSSWTVRAFGLVNLVGLALVALTLAEAFASMWCVCAALASVLLLVHQVHRARAHDAPAPQEMVAA